MAFLVRCPFCRRPKRVNRLVPEPAPGNGFGADRPWCIGCSLTFVAYVHPTFGPIAYEGWG